MYRRVLAVSVLVAVLGCGRSSDSTAVATHPVNAEALSGLTFNVLAKTADESAILLGHLRFDAIAGTAVTGAWDLSQWSGPAAVPGLPTGGAFTGTLEGSTLILRLPLPDGDASLGIVAREFVGERLSGTLSLLPSLEFQSTFEAIRGESATP
jgi:hypothetical protein